jgi:heme-degrading monooxygenase HmoA
MYMRFVHLKVRKGQLRALGRFYEDRAIPALQATRGCVFASLLQPTGGDEDCLSLTLWSSPKAADAYEQSGLYDQLLDEMDEFLEEAVVWRVRLAGDRGGPIPSLQDPEVETFPVGVAAMGVNTSQIDELSTHRMFIRIVAARVEPSRYAELEQRYDEEVAPALLATKGCRAAFLVEGVSTRSRALSVTVWDSEQDALRYEASGSYDEQVSKLSEFFSGLYQWKLSVGQRQDRDEVTGRDLDVTGYHVVTARRLRGGSTAE